MVFFERAGSEPFPGEQQSRTTVKEQAGRLRERELVCRQMVAAAIEKGRVASNEAVASYQVVSEHGDRAAAKPRERINLELQVETCPAGQAIADCFETVLVLAGC